MVIGYFNSILVIEVCEEGGYHAWCPALTGCHSQGETLEEAKQNITEAIQCHIESLALDNEPIPVESDEFIGTVTVPLPVVV
ncbi:MAG: type II toxin-antitoxin system HicB family antitoxin [Candidatus Omnitrophica bacterium]|nr:type II toxin-antitoxin system HicB family antitoxin [Candidatus Omnitrophota bacterium]